MKRLTKIFISYRGSSIIKMIDKNRKITFKVHLLLVVFLTTCLCTGLLFSFKLNAHELWTKDEDDGGRVIEHTHLNQQGQVTEPEKQDENEDRDDFHWGWKGDWEWYDNGKKREDNPLEDNEKERPY